MSAQLYVRVMRRGPSAAAVRQRLCAPYSSPAVFSKKVKKCAHSAVGSAHSQTVKGAQLQIIIII